MAHSTTKEKEHITTINTVPFLYATIKDATNENLRDIATELAQSQPGFYFLISSIDNRYIFLGHLSQEYSNKIDIQKLSAWLKENYNLHGGVTNSIRGGGEKVNVSLEDHIKAWLEKQTTH